MIAGSVFAQLKAASPTLSVGILASDLMALGTGLQALEGTDCEVVHVDVMDGCWTPMMTVGPPLIKAMKTPMIKDVHLMIADPLAKVADYVAAGADVITVHVEGSTHVHQVLQHLGTMTNANDAGRGLVRGVALNPGTPLEVLDPLLDQLELIVLLGINPGWGGQRFLPATLDRAARVKKVIAASSRDILLGIDGGITRHNIGELAGRGIDLVVTGSAAFEGGKVAEHTHAMLEALRGQRPE